MQHLAWLDLDTHDGQEYWLAMNLAGDYAKACHDDAMLELQIDGSQPLLKLKITILLGKNR